VSSEFSVRPWVRRAAVAALLLQTSVATGSRFGSEFQPTAAKSLVVLGTRVAAAINIPEGHIRFVPYDPASGRLEERGFDVPGRAFSVGRGLGLVSNAAHQQWRTWAQEVEPGSYVLASMDNPNLGPTGPDGGTMRETFAFEVAPASITYAGDYALQFSRPRDGRGFLFNIIPSADERRARADLAAKLPGAAAGLAAMSVRPVQLRKDAENHWSVGER
jgi:hypothetical protein